MGKSWAEPGSYVAALDDSDFDALVASGRRRRFRKGEALFAEGDASDFVFVVTTGRVKVSCATDEGREVVLAVRGPGDLLGEMSAIDEEPRSASAHAIDDLEAVVLTSEEFTAWLEGHPRASLVLLRMLSAHLRDADRKRVEFAAHDAEGRVASRLVELSDRYGERSGEGVRISLPLTQEELAGWTGSSREAVSKALQSLRAQGWIETHRRRIDVLDLEGLRTRAT